MHPVAFVIEWPVFQPFAVGTYGLCLLAAVLLAWLVVQRVGAGLLRPAHWFELAAGCLIAGLAGAKLLHLGVLLSTGAGLTSALHSALLSGGVWLGGVALCALWVAYFIRAHQLEIRELLPVVVLALPLAHAVGRLGCLMAGCCYGQPTDLPWGVSYHSETAALMNGTPLGISLHPLPLYEVAAECINALVLLVLYRRGIRIGLLPAWLALYGTQRFFLELLRDDFRGEYFGLSTSQWLALVMLGLALAWFLRSHRIRPLRSLLGTSILMLPVTVWALGPTASGWFFNAGPSVNEVNATGVVLADIDGDTDLDAIVSYSFRYDAMSDTFIPLPNRVFTNDIGEFSETAQFSSVSSEDIAAGDIDGDGDVDLLVGNGYLPDNSGGTIADDQLWLNDGGGNFSAGAVLGNGFNTVVHLVDLDADTDLDIVIGEVNNGSNRISVHINQGGSQNGTEGVFAAPSTFTVGAGADIADLAVAPIDANVSPDLYVALGSNDDQVWFNDGTGDFSDSNWRIPGSNRNAVALGDLDGDLDLDLVAVNGGLIGSGSGIDVFHNIGSGFNRTNQFFELNLYSAVALADVNGDGDLDAVIGQESGGSAAANVFFNNGSLVLQHSGQCFAYQNKLNDIALGDLNGNLAPDAFFAGDPALDDNDMPLPNQAVTSAWFNNEKPGSGNCCPFEYLNELSIFGIPGPHKHLSGWLKGVGDGLADLALLDRIRDQHMSGREHGDRYINHFDTFGFEIVLLFQSMPAVHEAASDQYLLWQPALQALDSGSGSGAVIDAAMVQALDDFLNALSTNGSAALQQMISNERAQLPAFSTFIGITMTEFRDQTMGVEQLFADSFESLP